MHKLKTDTQTKLKRISMHKKFFECKFESLHKIEGGALALIHFHLQNVVVNRLQEKQHLLTLAFNLSDQKKMKVS